jgi:predicted lipoprotein with Yx(FWY)xxD motif
MTIHLPSLLRSLRFASLGFLVLLLAAGSFWPVTAQETEVTLSAAFTDTGIPTLVGPDGRTLYWFAHDHEGEPTCTGPCVEKWPPLILDQEGEPTVGEGLPGQAGTVAWEDGSLQVTYNGWPLYYYYEDTQPGQANGHGREDVWFAMPPTTIALSPSGEAGGGHLTSASGLTLYVFHEDHENESYCFQECAVAWPPLVVPEEVEPTAGPGLTGVISTTQRLDGSRQVTYAGWPLYFFKGDLKPGDMTGQGLKEVWFVAVPSELEAAGPGTE